LVEIGFVFCHATAAHAEAVRPQEPGATAASLQGVLREVTAGRLEAHVTELASDDYEGRGAGYPGEVRATAYIAERFAASGLQPVGDSLGGHPTFWQQFQLHPRRPPAPWAVFRSRNVLGYLAGADSALSREIVVIGAHHDGQGMAGQANMGRRPPPDSAAVEDTIYNSANDNGAAVAALLAIAEAMQRADLRTKRSILFVTFGAEEHGLVGSLHYVAAPAFAWERHVAMINLEMIGWGPDRPLNARASGTSPAWPAALDRVEELLEVEITRRTPQLTNDTDHYGFGARGVPAIHFGVGGAREHYHAVSDTPDRVDYRALATRARIALATLVAVADMPERPPFVDLERLDAGVTGTDATPDELDMVGLDPERGGVKLTAVVPGLAGDRAGLEAGDLVLAIDGRSLTREERGMRALGEVVRNADRGQAVELTVQKASGRLVLARLELR
jgi:hypothetical protein